MCIIVFDNIQVMSGMNAKELTKSDVSRLAGAMSAMLVAVCSNESQLDKYFLTNGVLVECSEGVLMQRSMEMFDLARQNGEDILKLIGGMYRDISHDHIIFGLDQCNSLFKKFDGVLSDLGLEYVVGGQIIWKDVRSMSEIGANVADSASGEESPVQIPRDITESIEKMGTAYLWLFALETTLRSFIIHVASNITFPPKLVDKIAVNKGRDECWGWIEKRNGGDLSYLDLNDLPSVV